MATTTEKTMELTPSDLFNKLKDHVQEELGDAEFYMKMACCFKKVGMNDTAKMLREISKQELEHREMLIASMKRHDYPIVISEEDEDKALLVHLKLKKI